MALDIDQIRIYRHEDSGDDTPSPSYFPALGEPTQQAIEDGDVDDGSLDLIIFDTKREADCYLTGLYDADRGPDAYSGRSFGDCFALLVEYLGEDTGTVRRRDLRGDALYEQVAGLRIGN